MPLSQLIERILAEYGSARSEPFGSEHTLWRVFEEVQQTFVRHPLVRERPTLAVKWSAGAGNWARVPWIAFLDRRETDTTQRGVYPVFLFREDMSGVYLTFNQGVTQLKKRHGTREARRILRERARKLRLLFEDIEVGDTSVTNEADRAVSSSVEDYRGFSLDDRIDLRTSGQLPATYEASTVAHKLYERGQVPSDEEIFADLKLLLDVYDRYLASALKQDFASDDHMREKRAVQITTPERTSPPLAQFDLSQGLERLVEAIEGRGFVFEPFQIAQYVTALRTKPFVILAGITGTGKSLLPRLVSEETGGEAHLVPVRPDWTDSSDVLGYTDLQGIFRPGAVLEVAHAAMEQDDVYHMCILDEMNLARVEQYFAEVLSRLEDRSPDEAGGYRSKPLLGVTVREEDAEWASVVLPPNLGIVGTVNMDESAHGFSRKVLDRAFTIEFSDVRLEDWGGRRFENARMSNPVAASAESVTAREQNHQPWPVSAWYPRASRLSELTPDHEEERALIDDTIRQLSQVNAILSPAQLQIGYRTRDEIVLFLRHAREVQSVFRTRDGEPVSPLDLALEMKILPRIIGGSGAIRRALLGLLGWSWGGAPLEVDADAEDLLRGWEEAGRPPTVAEARYPGLAARLCLMWERLRSEGFTSYWL